MVKQPTLNEQVKDVRFTCIVKIIPIVHNYPNLDKYNKKLFINDEKMKRSWECWWLNSRSDIKELKLGGEIWCFQ